MDQVDITTINPAASLVGAKKKRSFNFHRNSTFLSLMIGYAGYYLCRQNFSVAYAPMKTELGIDPVVFGTISSLGTLLYAIGKVTTGALADTRGGRFLFFVGLFGSAIASICFSLGSGIALFFVLWGTNRFFQSMGWGGLVNVMSRWFAPKDYGTAMGVMSINYQFGGVLASVFAGFLLSMGFGWRGIFVIPGIVLLAIGLLIWPFLVNCPKDVGHARPAHKLSTTESLPESSHEEQMTYLASFKAVLKDKMFLLMCALSFVLTLLRECFSLWMPAYFTEMGAKASTAAFKSAIFPLLGCVGTLAVGWVSDKYLEGRRAPVMAVLLLGLALSLFGLGHLDAVAAFANVERGSAALFLVAATGFLLLGPYSLVGGVVALDFGGRRTAGTAAGLLDGVGYLGATLAGYGVATVLVARGWAYAYSLMAILTLIAVLLCAFLWRVRPR